MYLAASQCCHTWDFIPRSWDFLKQLGFFWDFFFRYLGLGFFWDLFPTIDALIWVENGLRWRNEACHNFTVSGEMKLKFNSLTIYQIKKDGGGGERRKDPGDEVA